MKYRKLKKGEHADCSRCATKSRTRRATYMIELDEFDISIESPICNQCLKEIKEQDNEMII